MFFTLLQKKRFFTYVKILRLFRYSKRSLILGQLTTAFAYFIIIFSDSRTLYSCSAVFASSKSSVILFLKYLFLPSFRLTFIWYCFLCFTQIFQSSYFFMHSCVNVSVNFRDYKGFYCNYFSMLFFVVFGSLPLIRLGILKVVFSEDRRKKNLIQYWYNVTQLLHKLFKVRLI